MPIPQIVPPQLLHRPFRSADAVALGVTPTQLRGSRFESPFHGMHVASPPADLTEMCRAAELVLPADATFSDSTAARLHGLPTVGRDDRLHVTVPPPLTAIRRPGIVGHVRLANSADVRVISGLRCTSACRTYLDLAETLRRPDLVALVDAILRAGLAGVDEIAAAIDNRAGRRGNDKARRALGVANPRSESPMESLLRVLLLDAGLPVPEVNVEVFDPTGRFLARADLYFRLARLLVEYDGDQHRRDAGQFAHDVRRLSDLAAHGYLVLRFTAADLFGQPERVVSTVATALRQRAHQS